MNEFDEFQPMKKWCLKVYELQTTASFFGGGAGGICYSKMIHILVGGEGIVDYMPPLCKGTLSLKISQLWKGIALFWRQVPKMDEHVHSIHMLSHIMDVNSYTKYDIQCHQFSILIVNRDIVLPTRDGNP